MKIHSVEFLGSADHISKCPPPSLPEIAFAGRSNVGKSSLINALLKRKEVARVSSTPGKTRLINFFRINGSFHLVDLPGYGYAKRSKTERKRWADFLEGYITGRETLKAVVLLSDVSIPPQPSDQEMKEWLEYHGITVVQVFTKADKARKADLARRMKEFDEAGQGNGSQPLVISVRKGQGIDGLWSRLQGIISSTS